MKDTKMMIDTLESSINIFTDSSFYYNRIIDTYRSNAGVIIVNGEERIILKSVSNAYSAYNNDVAEIVAIFIGLEKFYRHIILEGELVFDKRKKHHIQVFTDNANAKNSVEHVLGIKYTRHYPAKIESLVRYAMPDLKNIQKLLGCIGNEIKFSIDFVYVPAHAVGTYREEDTYIKFIKHNIEYVAKHDNSCTGLLHKFLRSIINLNDEVDMEIRNNTYMPLLGLKER
jgi:ribonuclease HI